MASLYDLMRGYLSNTPENNLGENTDFTESSNLSPMQNPPPTPGIMQTVKGLANPVGALQGLYDTGKMGLESIGGNILNAAQAVSPVKIPGATDTTFDPTQGLQLGKRFGALGNAALMGLPDQLAKRINEEYSDSPPKNTEGHFENVGAGAAKFVLKDILPGEEIKQLVSGVDETGKPLASRDVYRLINQGILKTTALKGGIEGLADIHQKLKKYLPEETRVAKTITTGEIAAAKALKPEVTSTFKPMGEVVEDSNNATGAALGAEVPKPPTTPASGALATDAGDAAKAAAHDPITPEGHSIVDENLPPGQVEYLEAKRSLLSSEEVKAVTAQVATHDIAKKVLADAAKAGDPILTNEIVARVVEQGALQDSGKIAQQISDRHGVPIAEVSDYVAKAIRDTATESGQTQQAFSAAADLFEGSLREQAQQGGETGVNALKALRDLKKASQMTWARAHSYGDAYRWISNLNANGLERFRRGLMTSNFFSAARNAAAQVVGGGVVQLMEDSVSGIGEAVTGKLKGDNRPLGDYFGDVMSDFSTAASRFTPEGRNQLERVLNNLPLTKDRLLGQNANLAFDSNLSVLQNWRKGLRPEGLGEWAEATTSALNIANNAQEMVSRRLFFRSRLDANLKMIGKSWGDLEGATKSQTEGAFDPYRQIVADAEEHALKQTYAWNPTGPGPAQAILNVYKHFPFGLATAVLPPFPRFLINQFRWQMERSPTLFFDLFSPEFRDGLYKGAEGGLQTKNMQRQMGKAVSGMFLTNAAYNIRASEMAGPKYYQFAAGTKNEKGEPEYFDFRPYQPFVSYLFAADWLHAIQKGQKPNIDANEMLDAMTGVRRLGEVPIFALPDIMRAASSDNPDTFWKALQTPVGQYIGSFFTPLQQLREAYGAAGHEQALVKRDIGGQELIGPAMQAIPGVSELLPPRVSPFTGEAMKTEHPLRHLLSGLDKQGQSKLSELVSRSNLAVGDIVGKYGNPDADNLVAKHMGEKVAAENGKVGNGIADAMKEGNFKPDVEKYALQRVFASLRQEALKKAMTERPDLFMGHVVEQHVPTQTLKDLTNKYLNKAKTPPTVAP